VPVPQNAQAIYTFLIGQGFSPNAAAGIVGNIEQESGGNPAAPGGGLIQILQGNPGYTSNTSLAAQEQAMMTYINANGSVKDINLHSTSPTAAATYFSQQYERPGIPNLANRIQSAIDVAAAAVSGNWPQSLGLTSSAATTSSDNSLLGGLLGIPSEITGAFTDLDKLINALMWLLHPSSWVRIGSFFIAILLLAFGVYALMHVGSDEPLVKMPSVVPVPI